LKRPEHAGRFFIPAIELDYSAQLADWVRLNNSYHFSSDFYKIWQNMEINNIWSQQIIPMNTQNNLLF